MTIGALYLGFVSPILGGAAPPLQGVFHQCWINTYDCGDFSTRFDAQNMACGGRRNDVRRLDRDGDCEWLP